jgi:acyl-CoA thioesterase I
VHRGHADGHDHYSRELGKLLNAGRDAGAKDADAYDVRNYGVADSTIVLTEKPWIKSAKFGKAKAFMPNIVVIMMGTQDCQKGRNLDQIATFVPEYEKLIAEFSALPTKPRIFICLPPPIVGSGAWGMTSENLEAKVIPGVKQVAKDLDLPLLDTHTPLSNRPELFHNNVHLVGESNKILASVVYKAITGQGETAAPATTRAAGGKS